MEDLNEFIEELSKEDCLIIVEGKKDIKALEAFGISSVELKGSIPLFCEKTAKEHKKVILLMDADKEGAKLMNSLVTNFSKLGAVVDKSYWHTLRKLKISHVEGIKL